MLLKFWGTRGTIPSPLRPDQVEQKIKQVLKMAGQQKIELSQPRAIEAFIGNLSLTGSTVGSNTTCVTVELEDDLIIFDAGSGIRELGEALMDRTLPRNSSSTRARVTLIFSLPIPIGTISRAFPSFDL
jgi:hypothetical protein